MQSTVEKSEQEKFLPKAKKAGARPANSRRET
jgi:hypothetical protein